MIERSASPWPRRGSAPHGYPTNSLHDDAQQELMMRGVLRCGSPKSAVHTRFRQMVRDFGGEVVGPEILQGVAGSNPVSPTVKVQVSGFSEGIWVAADLRSGVSPVALPSPTHA